MQKLVATTTIRGFQPYMIPAARLAELIETPALAELRALSFQFSGGSAGQDDFEVRAFERLSKTPVGEHLHSLSLRSGLSAKGLRALASAKSFGSLRRLRLAHLAGDTSDWCKLTTATMFRGLTQLQLALPDPEIAEAMSDGLGTLPDLHTLDLRRVASEAVGGLTTGAFSRLVRFEVGGCKLTSNTLRELLDREWFERLRVLDLASTNLGDRAISSLAAHPVAGNLRVLRLGNNKIGTTGLMALGRGRFSNLRRLSLSVSAGTKSRFTDTDLASFLSSLQLPQLRCLELRGLPLGHVGVWAIAANSAFEGLRELWLGEGVTENGMKALKDAKHLQQARIV
ncbi:MAG: hypothetical protein J0I06_19845 [Planctomycetes bacterium]|nr:hypothetical protein [Planctomycetota bacterium]